MDLKLNIECRECGWLFRRRMKNMSHGSYLKCPFCHSSSLEIKGDMLVEDVQFCDSFEYPPGDRMVERKFKLD